MVLNWQHANCRIICHWCLEYLSHRPIAEVKIGLQNFYSTSLRYWQRVRRSVREPVCLVANAVGGDGAEVA